MTSRAVTAALGTSFTPAMLRALFVNDCSGFTSMTSVFPVAPSRFRSAAVSFVLASLDASRSTTMIAPSLIFCASAARSAPRCTFFGISNS
jgi:hypothetical protein